MSEGLSSIRSTDSSGDELLRRQEHFQQALAAATRAPYVTFALIALNVIVFLAMILTGVSPVEPTVKEVLPWGANFWPLTASGEWWRLVTACFLHFGVIHIAMNMYILLQVGVFTEKLFGNVRFLLLYLLAGVGGNIAGLYVHPMTVGAGASGAIFGVYGALLAFLLIERGVVPTQSAIRIAKSAGIFLAYNVIYGLARPETDMVAHGGGFVTGMVAGALLARPLAAGFRHIYPARTLLVAAGGFALAFVAMGHLPKISPDQAAWIRLTVLGPSITTTSKDQIVYSGTATKADADKLARAMVNVGFFRKPGLLMVLSKDAQGTLVSIPVRENQVSPGAGAAALQQPWQQPDFLAAIQMIGAQAASALGGPPLTLRLVSGKGELRKVIDIDHADVLIGLRDRVSYSGGATEADAVALGSALRSCGFFQDRGAVVALSRHGGVPEIAFHPANGGWNNPRIVPVLTDIGRKVATSVGGPPINVLVLDEANQVRKSAHIP